MKTETLPVLELHRRTFEAERHPKGSAERERLNLHARTSEYSPSKPWLACVPFFMSDGSVHPQRHTHHTFRTKKEATECLEAYAKGAAK
jgi:hypothetical protein